MKTAITFRLINETYVLLLFVFEVELAIWVFSKVFTVIPVITVIS